MEWLDTNQLKIVPPKKPKKITGTRFAAIMGKNTAAFVKLLDALREEITEK